MRNVPPATCAGNEYAPDALLVVFSSTAWIWVDQLSSVPVSCEAASCTSSFQVPSAACPSSPDSACSGRNVPVYGGEPDVIGVAASSSKVVFVKLSPPLPRRLTSV